MDLEVRPVLKEWTARKVQPANKDQPVLMAQREKGERQDQMVLKDTQDYQGYRAWLVHLEDREKEACPGRWVTQEKTVKLVREVNI